MDPSGTPPTPSQQPPNAPEWGQPVAPPEWQAGQPGMPGQPATPWQPGMPGQPGMPEQPGMPGQPPMWAPPPAPKKRSRLPVVGVGILVLVALAVGFFVFVGNGTPPDAGKVVFSTDKPAEGRTTGCQVNNQVTTIAAGKPVYATYEFTGKQGSDVVSWSISKDGSTYLGPYDLDTKTTSGLSCLADTTDLSTVFQPGSYTFTATSNGKTIAQGTLVVTP